MLLIHLWKLLWGRASGRGFSLKGFWGVIHHFNKFGQPIGYTFKDFLGRWMRYDVNGRLTSFTIRTFWGAYYTYDADGNLIRKSIRNFWGGFTTFDRFGKKIIESFKNVWGGLNHFDVEEPDASETYTLSPLSPTEKKKKTSERKAVSEKIKKAKTRTGVTSGARQYEKDTKNNSVKQEKKEPDHKPYVEKREATNSTMVERREAVQNFKEEREVIIQNNSGERKSQAFEGDSARVKTKARDDVEYDSLSNKLELDYSSKEGKKENVSYYESISQLVKMREAKEPCAKILVFSYEELKDFPACVYEKENELEIIPLMKGEQSFTITKKEIQEAKKEILADLDMSVMDTEFDSFGLSSMSQEFDGLFPEYEFTTKGISRGQYKLESGMILTENSWIALNEMIKEE